MFLIEEAAVALAALFSCVQTLFCMWVGFFMFFFVGLFFLHPVADILKWETCWS